MNASVIARVFRELHLSEQWGSGVRRIFAMAKEQGLPAPSLTEIATGVRLSVPLTQVHTVDDAHSAQELLAALQLSNAYLNYKRHIVPLLERGLIAMTIPDKPQSRLQRYRLTPEGRALLAAVQTTETP